jgi:choloylglycine hydrolase
MKLTALTRRALRHFALGLLATAAAQPAAACTRALYTGAEGTVITGRSMDWSEDLGSNLWVFPAGFSRDGAAGKASLRWTSKYGSVVVSAYEAGSSDGLNEKGLAANLLYLAEASYAEPSPDRPDLSIAAWAQYVLDEFATVAEAVAALSGQPFDILAPELPNGVPAALHLSISDASGDSAIFEYVDGKLVIHHGKQYTVMTNSPAYAQQLALNAYWQKVGGLVFLPGTNRAADRFARASFLLDAIPRAADPNYLMGVPGQSYANQAVASVLSVMRAVSVPLGISTPGEPNIASTIWRTAADQKNLVYFFDPATRPNAFWVSLSKLDLEPGAPVKTLTVANGEVFSGEVADDFVAAEPFKFLPATAKP